MEKHYALEIYEPNSADTAAAIFESDAPFGAISKGDLINPIGTSAEDPKRILRVAGIEHIIWKTDEFGPKHKTCIFTTSEINDRSARFGFQADTY